VKGIVSVVAHGLVIASIAAPAGAQTTAPPQPPAAAAPGQPTESRYQISQMERMLEGAVEHGATRFRERLQAVLPSQLLLTENARVRGFRLDGYGVFFDVEVPGVEGTALAWSLRTLDQNDLGLERALKELKTYINAAGDTNLQQALKRIELQMTPAIAVAAAAPAPASDARSATGAPAVAEQKAPADPILNDPDAAYHAEIKSQIMEAMLDWSGPLAIRVDEWLTVAARRHDERPIVAPADSNAQTVIIRIRGGDLAAFRAGQLTKDDTLKRIDVRVF